MAERFKAGIGLGIMAIMLAFAAEDVIGFRFSRDGFAFVAMAAAAFGAAWAGNNSVAKY